MTLLPLFFIFAVMEDPKNNYSFWTKYKRFAKTEILLYLIMVVGIILGIVICNLIFNKS